MVSTNTEQEWNRKEVEKRLDTLWEKDNLWPAVLAARAALRVFPLFGVEGHFNFFIGSEGHQHASEKQHDDADEKENSHPEQDNRARFLLASFFAIRLILQQASLPTEQRQVDKLVGSPARAAGAAIDAIAWDAAAFDAARAATAAIAAFNTASSARSTRASSTSSVEVASSVDVVRGAFLQDLKTAENGDSTNSVLNSPLWLESCPEEIKAIKDNKFSPAVNSLIREIPDSNPDNVNALAHMLTLYEGYLNGSATADKDTAISETLYEAQSKLTAEDANSKKDTLNRGALVSGLAGILCDDAHTQPLTIGLMGHWGSGKTQVLALLKKELKSRDCRQPFLFGEFNAWAYEHAKNSQAAMAHEVISALTCCDRLQPVDTKSKWYKRLTCSMLNLVRQLLWTVGGRIRLIYAFAMQKHFTKVLQSMGWFVLFVAALSWLVADGLSQNTLPDFSKPLTSGALVALLASLWQFPKQLRDIVSQPMTKEFLTYIKLPNYVSHIGEITEMQKDIRLIANIRLGFVEEQCHDHLGKVSKPRRLLFVVDDLDRCSPKGIVKTFEAIRLVLHIPQVTVVVAVDQRIALAALALHYKDIEPYHTLQDARAIARDYLAKMIQLPVVVSDGDNKSLTGFLSDIWQEKGDKKLNWLKNIAEDREPKKQEINASTPDLDEPDIAAVTTEMRKRDADSDIEGEGFTEVDWVKMILEDDPKPEPEILPGLSDHQKAALYYWTTHFGLCNARQLKRLDNSYNLIRLVTDKEDQIGLQQAVGTMNSQQSKFSYGYLVTLMTLEFINGIEVTALREDASRFLRKGDEAKLNSMANQQHKETLMVARIIIQHTAEQLYLKTDSHLAFDQLLRYIENFVLPAIDGFDIDTETASSF
ncbi:conserved hypothetical protein [Alteromonas sp. 38]|uniref:KAP family P-loop NTPase fold protein n=1 Tax=Alteromonas TaxID=226 RepID=UPI0012EF9D63|nr:MULTISPECIES: P-loop NTPase fold protein [Alteromonas]CAD5269082.1 conserved hypothetical protein [Alteromonas sp. 154]VXC00449.1 conserved hypothetical protein [Alteromonas sp. 38]